MRRKKIHEAFNVCIPIKKLHEVRFRVLKFCYSALPSPKRFSWMLKFLVRCVVGVVVWTRVLRYGEAHPILCAG